MPGSCPVSYTHLDVYKRQAYTEKALKVAVLTGTKQYVMLGAGMDTFAFRETEFLSKHRVFAVSYTHLTLKNIPADKLITYTVTATAKDRFGSLKAGLQVPDKPQAEATVSKGGVKLTWKTPKAEQNKPLPTSYKAVVYDKDGKAVTEADVYKRQVRILPMISTTEDSLMVKSRTSRKKIPLVSHKDTSPNTGSVNIS